MKKRQFSVWSVLLATALLVGCSKHDDDRLPGGTQPVTLTATMEGQSSPQAAQAATRATSANTWTGGEVVAVQIGGVVKNYIVSNHSDGTLTPNVSVEPFYWTSNTEKKTVETWFPYSNTKPMQFTVKADQNFQNTGLSYQQSDMIYASQEISYTNPSLVFRHLPVKVVVNLTNGKGVTADEVQSATVSLVNQHLISGTIATDWSVTQQTTQGSNAIAPNVLGTATNGYQKSVQALVVPQKSIASVRLIKVSVAGQEFYYSTAPDFAAGTQHTYNITVLKSGITVTASGVQAWTGTTTDVTSKDPKQGFSAADLKIGDFYYSDGATSDGGYREYTDGSKATLPIMPVLTDASGNARTVVGIVFKVGKDDNGDWKDDCTYTLKGTSTPMTTIHGYVLGLYDAKDGNGNIITPMWGSYGTEVGTNQERYTGFYGYKNTNAIKAFVAAKGMDLQTDFPATYHATVGYEAQFPAPANSSGWFLPSAGQGKYWLNNRDALLASVKKATGDNSYNWQDNIYWSSSEHYYYPAYYAWVVYFDRDDVGDGSKNNGHNVRSIFAF